MGFLKDFKRLMTGKYITVDEVAHGFETTETDARVRLDALVDDDVLKEIKDGVYVPADSVTKDELVKAFNTKFSDLRSNISDELTHLEP